MKNQTTNTILMIEPVLFGFNAETAVNNYFQQKKVDETADLQKLALEEFRNMVELLRAKGIDVIVVKDTKQPHTPDSIFPNNWISFHDGGQVVLYPMFAPNRRLERRRDIMGLIEEHRCVLNNVDDFSFWEEQNLFLEGTGSMVLDRENKIAYAALSERTDKTIFLQFCCTFGFEAVCFTAFQSVDDKRLPIYHTNVMLSVCDNYVIICTDTIDDIKERTKVLESFKRTGKTIVEISELQINCFAGNMLQVNNKNGKTFLVMSQTAYSSLQEHQIEQLKSYNELIIIPIPTIEQIGGGSVRCMMAEIF
ncbi:MAG: arginine deiminase-related protein [Paludibacter sp.]